MTELETLKKWIDESDNIEVKVNGETVVEEILPE